MKTKVCSVLTLLIAMFAQSLACAAERVWEDGTVWSVAYVETKPGKFNDYIADLNNGWRQFNEKDDAVVSYHILQVPAARDNEPNLILLVEYENWAAFDRGVEYFDELAAEIFGSSDRAIQESIDREDIRVLRGSLSAQEVVFK